MEDTIYKLILVSTLLPLFSSIIVIFFGKRFMGVKAGWFATGAMAFSCLLSIIAGLTWANNDLNTIVRTIPWIPVPGTSEAGDNWLYLGLLYDDVTAALMFMVTFIATLVHLYSIGYMAGDKRFERFFAYLSLFTFSMLGIITANGIMQLFVFWELVGLSSYLLIGFWFEKRGPQLACKKAFVMNRIGDTGFLIGFGILFHQLGAKVLLPGAEGGMFDGIAEALGGTDVIVNNPPMWLTVAGIGLFFGAMGKSAQFPLHTWLPDAMEGPTPVSSIVHSATMVAAGVYLTARIYPILTPAAHLFICTIGLITLVMAALMAMVMTDIKRVLAYSTLSQLGYMILGVGSGAYIFALFHLITHAFFKCCLFQCSGSVINAAHHEQDMTQYGGLGKKMPLTMAAYLVCTLAIAGASIPFLPIGLSGFYSKDGIIGGTYNYAHALGGWGSLFLWGPIIVAYITPFYMARSFALTFMGKPRNQHIYDHAEEQPWTMTVPQLVLAIMAIISGPILFWDNAIINTQIDMAALGVSWVPGMEELGHGIHVIHLPLLYGFTWILMIGLGIFMYKDGFTIADRITSGVPGLKYLHAWAKNKFYFDALFDIFVVAASKALANLIAFIDRVIVDGLVNFAALLTKLIASGVGQFDKKVVDGAVNGAATLAQSGGQVLRVTQGGRIRGYVLAMLAMAAAATLIVVVVAVVVG